jgi:hypothetical protein
MWTIVSYSVLCDMAEKWVFYMACRHAVLRLRRVLPAAERSLSNMLQCHACANAAMQYTSVCVLVTWLYYIHCLC